MAVGPLSYNAPINFFIPQQPPVGIPEELKPAFQTLYNALQQIILALVNNCGIGPQNTIDWPQLAGLPTTLLFGNMGRFYVTASENIQQGAMVNLYNNAGSINVRNANATNNTKPAHGFCSTAGGILAGAVGEVTLLQGVATITGLTVGTRYYLSTTNGLVTNVAPVAAGNIEQYIGIAITGNTLLTNIGYWIQH